MRPARLLIRLFLLLYPRRFRRRYGAEMEELFLWRIERGGEGASGRLETLWTTAVAAWDLGRGGVRERFTRRRWDAWDRAGTTSEGMMTTMWRDGVEAVRKIVRAPVFGVTTAGILALGLGANIAVFTVVNAVLLRPPPYEDPERVVSVYQDSDDGEPSSSSYPAVLDMARSDVFSGVAASSPEGVTWHTGAGLRPALVEYATSSYLPVLGMSPTLGRWFEPRHDRVGSEMVAVVSHEAWRSRLGGDPGVVGRSLRLNGQPVTVVGVGPEELNGFGGVVVTDFWLSISSTPVGGAYRVQNLERRQDHWYDVKARLAPGVSVDQARAAMDALAADLAERFPDLNRGRGITVFASDEVHIHPEIDRMMVPVAGALLAVAGLVLLLVLSNLANLLLVRGISRGPEVAVRRALGAGRMRIMRLFLAEALLLAGVGGAAGLLLAHRALESIPVGLLPGGISQLDLAMDGRVVLFTVLLTLGTGALFGILPALRAVRPDVSHALREGGGRAGAGGRRSSFVRNALVGIQVAVSLMLMVGAGLLARSLGATQSVDVGIDADRVAYLATSYRQGGISSDEGSVMTDELAVRVRGLPGVESVALASRLPVQGGRSSTTVVEGYEPTTGTGAVELAATVVTEGYFETLGIPVLAGRSFDDRDRAGTERVVVVNETFARRFLDDLDPAGHRLRPQAAPDAWRQIVGVVGDVRVASLQEPPRPMMYYPAEQSGLNSVYLLARTAGDPADLLSGLRAELERTAPGLPLTDIGTMEGHLGDALAVPRLTAGLLGGFALMALLLASVGIYAVVSFSVAKRTAEVGIRIALGAGRTRVVATVVGDVLVTVGLAVVMGGGVVLLAGPAVEGVLYGVSGVDPVSLGGALLVLVTAAGVAAYLPARRAAGADPSEALRVE